MLKSRKFVCSFDIEFDLLCVSIFGFLNGNVLTKHRAQINLNVYLHVMVNIYWIDDLLDWNERWKLETANLEWQIVEFIWCRYLYRKSRLKLLSKKGALKIVCNSHSWISQICKFPSIMLFYATSTLFWINIQLIHENFVSLYFADFWKSLSFPS